MTSTLLQAQQATASFPWDQVINIVFFAIGFILGLIQLWQSQKYFLADQQSKFDYISQSISRISERLATIEGATQRLIEIDRTLVSIGATSNSFQDRLFGIVEQKFTVSDKTEKVTADALDRIRGEIIKEFDGSGVTVEKLTSLEEKINTVLDDLNLQLLRSNVRKSEDVPKHKNQSQDLTAEKGIQTIKFEEITLALETQSAWYNGEFIHLSQYEYLTLKFLMLNPEKTLSLRSIVDEALNESSLSAKQKNLHAQTTIHKLRSKVDPEHKYFVIDEQKNSYMLRKNSN